LIHSLLSTTFADSLQTSGRLHEWWVVR